MCDAPQCNACHAAGGARAPPGRAAHEDEQLRHCKPLWQELAAKVPRDGSLRIPVGGSAPAALKGLERDFFELPFIKPKPAATRAAAAALLQARLVHIEGKGLQPVAELRLQIQASGSLYAATTITKFQKRGTRDEMPAPWDRVPGLPSCATIEAP